MFCSPAGGKYPFFWAPARGLQPLNYIFVLSSELNSTTGWSIKRSPSPWRYFNPGSQAVLRARVQRRTVGHLSNMKMMSRNISRPIALAYPFFCIGSWTGVKHNRISKNVPPPYLLIGKAALLFGSITQSQTKKGAKRQFNTARGYIPASCLFSLYFMDLITLVTVSHPLTS